MNYTYSNDMWLGFDSIITHFNEERNRLKKILYVFSEKKNMEFEYAENLKNLYNFYAKTEVLSNKDYTMTKAIDFFFEEMKKESQLHFNNVKMIEENIIKELHSLLEKQIEKSSEYTNSINTYPKAFSFTVKTLESYRMQFQSAVKQAESKIQANQKLIDDNIQKNKTNFTLPKKDEEKQMKLIQKGKELEKNYMNFIQEANQEREKFIKTTAEILSSYQEMDINYIQTFREKMNQYSAFSVQMCKQKLESYENQVKAFSEISESKDLPLFIQKNETNMIPPSEFKFIPYHPENQQRFSNKNSTKFEVYKKVCNILNQYFKDTTKESITDPQMIIDITNIESAVMDICNQKDVDLNNIYLLIDKSTDLRSHFLNMINKLRIEGLFTIQQKTFDNLSKILNHLLEKLEEKSEYELMKFCMTLSLAFNIGNDKAHLLQHGICKNPIFQKEKTWKELITYSIKADVSAKEAGYLNFLEEKKEEKEKRVHSIIYGILVTYWFSMQSFNYPPEKAKDIIKTFADKYNIDVKEINGIDISRKDIINDFTTVSHEDIIEKPENYEEKK